MPKKSRLGKTDIFTSTTRKKVKPAAGITVKAPVTSSIENKMTVIMPPDQVAFLDRLCLDIRAKTRSKIRRTEVIRALVAGVEASKIDLTTYGTEEAIASAIQKQLSQ